MTSEKELDCDKAYDMSSLLKKYNELLVKRGVDRSIGRPFSRSYIVLHQPYQESNPEFVYSRSTSLQDVTNASAIRSNEIYYQLRK